MQWQDEEMLMGHDSIDAEHREFFEKLAEANKANDIAFVPLFMDINQHLIDHFKREDQLMVESNFSAKAEHQGEHLRVLGEMNKFKKRVELGRVSMARSYLNDTLPAWFKLHLMTMDSALVANLTGQK